MHPNSTTTESHLLSVCSAQLPEQNRVLLGPPRSPTIPAASVGEPRRPASAGTGDVAAWFYPSPAASHADAGSEDQTWPGAWLLRIARGAGRESLSIGVSKSHRRQLFGIEHLYRCAPKTHFPV